MSDYILSCESTVDMPYSYVNSRNMPVLFYTYTIDGKEYIDDMQKDPQSLPAFYKQLDEGKLPSTSLINQYVYEEFFDELLQKGDVLHIAFGTGMTKSYLNADLAAKVMRKKYPDRKLIVIDSLCSSSGYGLIVDYAADLRDEGKSIEETAQWVRDNCLGVHHQFYSTRLDFFRRSGRMSGPTSMIATILSICPIMHLDHEGKIIAYSKVRGKKNAVKTTIEEMLRHARNGADYNGKCFISHSNCPEEAEILRDAIIEKFKNLNKDNIRIFNIGCIIASHSGPGTVAVFFLGDDRKPD